MFKNREQAGRELARHLQRLHYSNPIVLGIPRGGVVIAAAAARELGIEFDIVLVRKLRAPFQPEMALGAISESGEIVLSEEAAAILRVSEDYMEQEIARQQLEISRRREYYRSVRRKAPLEGRSVIVADDGIATGSTVIAAAQVVRSANPKETIIAVPVGTPERLEKVGRFCDRVICPHPDPGLMSVGQYYEDFRQVSDEEVLELLGESGGAAAAAASA